MTIDQFKTFVSDTARPFAIIASSSGAAIATVIIAMRVTSFGEGALFIGAVFTGVGALYAAKSWEVSQEGKHSASVEIAKATADPAKT